MKKIIAGVLMVFFTATAGYSKEIKQIFPPAIPSGVHEYGSGYPSDHREWLACEKSDECTSVEVGCYYWLSVNKKHAAAMLAEYSCRAHSMASPSGSRPASSCVRKVCENDYTGMPLKLLDGGQRIELIQQRIGACLEPLGVTINCLRNNEDYSWCRMYLLKIVDSIRQDTRMPDRPSGQIVSSFVPCGEIVVKAKTLNMK